MTDQLWILLGALLGLMAWFVLVLAHTGWRAWRNSRTVVMTTAHPHGLSVGDRVTIGWVGAVVVKSSATAFVYRRMKRRDLLKALAALVPTWALVSHAASKPPLFVGYLDVPMARARGWNPATVTLNGVDVSDRAVAVFVPPTGDGWVEVFARDDRGAYRPNDRGDDLLRERWPGHVVFTPRRPAAGRI